MRLLYLFILCLVVAPLGAQSGKVTKLPEAINSNYRELAPILSADGALLYFSRAEHPQNMGMESASDIWLSIKKADGNWSKAINVGAPVNGNQKDQLVGLSVAARQMQVYSKDKQLLKRFTKEGRSWNGPVLQEIKGFQPKHLNIEYFNSYDGRILMISMEDSLSVGENDIYVSFLSSTDTWSVPIHCGPILNSEYEELSMFLAADNKSLYFISDRPGGAGQMDIYYSKRLDDTWTHWSEPQNVGAAINTQNNERSICVSVSGDEAFFVRSNSEGADIYTCVLDKKIRPEPTVLIKGHLKKADSGDGLQGEVILQPMGGDYNIEAFEAEPGGGFQFLAPYGENLCLFPVAKGYFPAAEPIYLSEQPIEELDYDPDNLLASAKENAAYAERDEEIAELQLHLRSLDNEMIELQQYRLKYIKEQAQATSFFDKSLLTDPELDALKHRYEQYFVLPGKEAQQDTVPKLTDEERAGITKGEVEDMKARYMRFYEYENNQKAAAEADEREAQFIWNERDTAELVINPDVLTDVEKSMKEKAERELREELVEEVAQELKVELTREEQKHFGLEPENLQEQLKRGLMPPAESSWTLKGQEKEEPWEQALRRELELKLQEKGVQEELKTQMEEQVKAQLKADMVYMAKKETRDKLAADLEKKMALQMAFENQSKGKANKNADAIQPLIPPAEMDKIASNIPEVEKDLWLIPAKVGMSIELKTVVFEANSAQLKAESYKELSRLLSFLQQNSELLIEVGAHTGGQLSHTTALHLSSRRAEQIVNYLIANGIDSARLKAKGYGKSLPVADNNTVEGQKKNQRIEIRILGQ
jgi:outer membrane protein OmpA-like peptidoglycan-associated protein